MHEFAHKTPPAGVKRAPSLPTKISAAPSAASGQPLDSQTRTFYEARFGYDFSKVRIHADPASAESAAGIGARAYTAGNAISFGHGEYRPETSRGRFLLAHELAHVVQQRNVTEIRAMPALGNSLDRAEIEADSAAHAVLGFKNSAPTGIAAGLSASPEPVLRRKVATWAGDFIESGYKPFHNQTSYGADIKISFSPNKIADATSIGLVQTSQSLVDDPSAVGSAPEDSIRMPNTVVSAQDKKVFESRLVDDMDPSALGTHIDATPANRTPLAGMMDPKAGNSALSSSIPGHGIQFGWRSEQKQPTAQDAMMWDTPRVTVNKGESASQTFETTALALEGSQKGAYYGSVRWGWTKESSADEPKLIRFQALAQSAPSALFAESAEKWNASKNTANEPSIQLPRASDKFVNAGCDLMEGAGTGKRLAKLDVNTRVQMPEEPGDKGWVRVVVTASGKVGWIKADCLSDRETHAKGKK